jgi:hypothetical protein
MRLDMRLDMRLALLGLLMVLAAWAYWVAHQGLQLGMVLVFWLQHQADRAEIAWLLAKTERRVRGKRRGVRHV